VKAVVLRAFDGELAVEDEPEPGGDVVEVRAAGINFLDVLIRRGRYPQLPDLPYVPGVEVAGELDGRRVLALTRHQGGGYAEKVAADSRWTFPLPESASFAEGAAFLMTFLTAYIPLVRQTRVGPGSTVLVHAAAGGVGSAAVQLARHLGARVVATAGSAEKRALARELGADEAWGYDEYAEHVRADVVVDPVGGKIFTQSLRVLEPLGTLIAIGYAGGLWEDVNPALIVGRNIGVQGFYLGRLMQLSPGLVRESALELLALWQEGTIRPVVGATFPLAEAARAHELIETRQSVGKVVLVP
jgi:NADPH2:quinone reductase